jgi:hypothetical protein
VALQSSSTTAGTGDNVSVSCNVFAANGAPLANQACTISIVDEPGDTAALGSKSVTKLTNSQGVATANLYVGVTPGVIVLEATSNGFTSSVLVIVEGSGSAPSPPQSPLSSNVISPPSTGDGGLAAN